MKAQFAVVVLCVLLLCAGAAGVQAAGGNTSRPDILILDFASSTGTESLSLTYPNAVPHAQVRRDISQLEGQLGAQFYNVKIDDAPAPIAGETMKMTSASFIGAHVLANTPNTVAVEPLILALRPYKHLSLHYFVNPEFKFEGLRDYQDRYVTIAFTPTASTYSYDIHITDPTFSRLNLPVYAVDPATVQVAAAPTTPAAPAHRSPWILVLIAVVALGLGGVVYSVLTRYL